MFYSLEFQICPPDILSDCGIAVTGWYLLIYFVVPRSGAVQIAGEAIVAGSPHGEEEHAGMQHPHGPRHQNTLFAPAYGSWLRDCGRLSSGRGQDRAEK